MITRAYEIVHRTRYDYSDDVSVSFGRGVLRPRDLPGQRCLRHQVTVDPVPADRSDPVDVYGNTGLYFSVTQAHRRLEVTGRSLVVVQPPPLPPGAARAWESARPAGSWPDGGVVDPLAVEFSLPSPMVTLDGPADDAVRDFAAASFRPGRPLAEAVLDLTTRIHREFAYRSGATTVRSTVAEVLQARAGVCQDFAHLAVACLRSVGLAGRYVSGYLATDPPPGRERMVGVDASHAWAAVAAPGTSPDAAPGSAPEQGTAWLAFDPTNGGLVDERYATVAWGRDYADVTPLRGVIFTEARSSELTVSVDVAPVPVPEELEV
ncbi:transglutaminase family protein [Nakamurella leprariae]|uniref:transglutaminase family protein n=1 Tax=Nakamurella leprariae TaxID=2803911 RepID=UPI002E2D2C89|nr:transglutaminase family protein [Nakamurella leprariae]